MTSKLFAILMLFFSQLVVAGELIDYKLSSRTALLISIKLEGDTTLKQLEEHDNYLIEEFNRYLAVELQNKLGLNVVASADNVVVNTLAEHTDLHHCNGCELDLAKQFNAELVVMPRVYRMSLLIQTLYLDIRDVKSGQLLVHKGRNFRGNTVQGWQHAIDNLLISLPQQLK